MNRKKNRNGRLTGPPASRQHFFGMKILLALTLVAVLGAGWHNLRQAEALPTAVPVVESLTATSSAAFAEASPDWQKLKGKWLRPDGGYIIEIKRVDDSGKMEAAYFNPKPIHVARAEASRVGGILRVFIELRDVNYPGSTYTLTYEPGSDQLKGIYFQAVQKQSYDVVFTRLKGSET